MSDIAAIRKQLKIRSGVVQRLTKENGLYRKEAAQLEKKKDDFIADGAEHWDISNATKMMEESIKMIHDTSTRLEKAVVELVGLITSAKGETELTGDKELIKAEEELIKAEEILKVAQGVDLKV